MVNPISGKVWNDVIRQAWVNLNRKYFKQDKYPWVIQNGPKSQNWFFSSFKARFIIFWKMTFGKMQKNFPYNHSKACLKRFRVLLHNAPMWNGEKQKIQFFFQFFQKQNRILLFEYFAYIKNVIFWGTSCWCSSNFDTVWGGTHKLQSQLLSPPSRNSIFELHQLDVPQKITFFI